jgi:hypothetical protein
LESNVFFKAREVHCKAGCDDLPSVALAVYQLKLSQRCFGGTGELPEKDKVIDRWCRGRVPGC